MRAAAGCATHRATHFGWWVQPSTSPERKRAEAEKEQLEAQLRQSQKLEAIGTLAGGIAHDFNNILGAILGYGELAQNNSPPDSNVRRYLDNVMNAAGRAKALVERILAFSRSGIGERVAVNVQGRRGGDAGAARGLAPSQDPPGPALEAGNAAVLGDATPAAPGGDESLHQRGPGHG